MSRKILQGGTVLAPLPAVLVTSGTPEKANVLTVAWTGIVNTKPPMTYVSIRPTRHSYNMIKESGEFVINLTPSKLVFETDFCGVKSGKDLNKIEKCKFSLEKGDKVSAPIILECPISLECKVVEVKPLGSHDMFLAEIVAINADDRYIDSKGKLNLEQTGIMAYSHGKYFSLGRKLGDFGYSVARKKSSNKNNAKKPSSKNGKK